ncbi:hypothetical protein [Mycobacteroides abscessus]|uniref:hypothetical protein n=1 Tax=Mycobacteroides abscessus TaxID=36809 RepID=UPI000926A8A7|nr:hypothetical protein [Mycobacteroides abscessus]SIJ94040.1 Uncharacterised protein [Mycobacteroides abscessus subsp. abscessus]
MTATLDATSYPVQIDRSYVVIVGAASDGGDVTISAWRGIDSDRAGLKRALADAGFSIDTHPNGTVRATRTA